MSRRPMGAGQRPAGWRTVSSYSHSHSASPGASPSFVSARPAATVAAASAAPAAPASSFASTPIEGVPAVGGLSLAVPPGWEVEIDQGAGVTALPPGVAGVATATPRTHAANFPLPPGRGDFGSGAVEQMVVGDALICLLEESPGAAASKLYASVGVPQLSLSDFSPDGMQRQRLGFSGAQAFFQVDGRAFVLYVVVASHLRRADVLDQINGVLQTIRVG